MSKIRTVLEMIKFEHSIFALPFALTAALLAAHTVTPNGSPWPTWRQVALDRGGDGRRALLCHDDESHRGLRYDRENPRTKNRALATGALSLPFAWAFTLASAAVLVIAAWQLNRLALELSPVALFALVFYSYTKRFTSLSHFVLGFCLGISPAAAWIAIAGSLDARMLILCAAVTLWVGGFDVLYACQDVDFDRRAGLFRFPSALASRAHSNRPHPACSDDRFARVAGGQLCASLARVGRHPGCGGHADLGAFAGKAQRPEPPQCCVFHHKRLY